jgi:DNA polymerase III delta prime subunit
MSNLKNSWWAEKYRPTELSEYVSDDEFKRKIEHWLEVGEINHLLLFSEKPGTGKTTIAKLIANKLDADVLYINASSENNVDMVREKITSFVSTIGFKRWKIVICDESDYLTINAQASLRNIIESFSKSSRFIFTCNHVERIHPAIRSRCTQFQIESPPKIEIAKRMKFILESENVKFSPKDLAVVITEFYPDQRSIINYLQDNSLNNELVLSTQNIIVNDYCNKIVEIFNSKATVKQIFNDVRQTIADSKIKYFNDLYRYLFDELDKYCGDGKKGLVILALAEGQYRDGLVIDKEINAMATIVNILNIIKT